jgi:O-antigen ligase
VTTGTRQIGPALALAAAAAMAAAAVLVSDRLVIIAAAAALAAFMVFVVPGATLPLLMVAGPLKETPVGEAVPVDLTLVTLLLVGSAAVRVAWASRSRRFAPPVALPLMMLFAAWLIVAIAWSPAGLAGGMPKALTFTFLSLGAFAAAMVIALSPTAARDLAGGLAVGATIVAWFATETGHPARPLALPGSTSQIDLGLIAAMGTVAILAYLIPASRGWWRLAWAIPLVILVPRLVGAGSRGALLAAIIAIAAVLAAQALTWPRRRPAVALASVGLAAGAVVAWALSPGTARQRYMEGLTGVTEGPSGLLGGAGGERDELMGRAVVMFTERPWGAGTDAYAATTGWDWPHNLLAETGAELGIVGLALIVSVIVLAIGGILRMLRRVPTDAALLALGVIAVPLVLSMSSFDLNGQRVLWIALGFAVGAASVAMPARPRP